MHALCVLCEHSCVSESAAQVLTRADRIKTTFGGIFDWRLSDEQMKALNALESGYRTCDPGMWEALGEQHQLCRASISLAS